MKTSLYLRLLAMEYGLNVKASDIHNTEVLDNENIEKTSDGMYSLYTTVGIYKEEIKDLDNVPAFKNIKTLYNICKLFESGISLYHPEHLVEIKRKVIDGSLACYDTYARESILGIIKFTTREESIFTSDGTLFVSSKMIANSQIELLVKALFLTMLGQDVRMLYLKGNISALDVTADMIKKNYLDSNLGLVLKLADYLDTTANKLLGLDFNIDYYAKNGLLVLPNFNPKSVSVESLTEESECLIVSKSLLDDFCSRTFDTVTVGDDMKLLVNGTELQEILS